MKIGKVPLATITMFAVWISRFAVKHLYPAKSSSFEPVFTGIFIILLVIYVVYYANIFIGAWISNRREKIS